MFERDGNQVALAFALLRQGLHLFEIGQKIPSRSLVFPNG